jgi:23S rRNA (guanosine2251-2'-O)-methyltransferase
MLADAPGGVKLDGRRGETRGRHVAPGLHAALAFVESRPGDVDRVLLARDAGDDLARRITSAGVTIERVDRGALDRAAAGIPHQGIVALGRPPSGTPLDDLLHRRPDLVLVLDEVTDPRNVGALLRSAEAAGAGAAVLARDRAPQLSPSLVKAAAGAVEWLDLVRVVNLARALEALRDAGYWTIGLAGEAETSLFDPGAIPGVPAALVVGAEGSGLRPLVRRACHRLVRIPMCGRTPSLNVSVAAAVALFEVRRAHRAGPDRSVGSGGRPTRP